MNRKKLEEALENFDKKMKRLAGLNTGDIIYEVDIMDPLGGTYFKHFVTAVDMDECYVSTKDQEGDTHKLYSFYLPSEVGLENED